MDAKNNERITTPGDAAYPAGGVCMNPRLRLGTLPTPVEPLPRLSARLGCQLFVKRDDMTGIAFGGNKVRKLEFVLADALSLIHI